MRPAVLLFFSPLLFLDVASCGARSELDTGLSPDAALQPTPDAGGASSCFHDAGPAPTCTTWQVAGPDRLVSEATISSTASQTLGSAIPLGCGLMLAWTSYTYIDPQTSELSWTTRTVGFDGTTTGPENVHSSLTVMSEASGSIEIAASTTGIGAVVTDEYNCRFLGLDLAGNDVGAPVTQPGSGCGGLASPGPGTFTYLVADGPQGETPTTLATVDGSGSPVSTRPLGDAPANALWGRLVFADGSFLLNAFREDPMTDVYTGVLQHFDATGTSLSPPVAQPMNSAPVMLAVTPSGALASWWTFDSSADFVPLAPSGSPAGSITDVAFVDAPYGEALASTPSGDVLVALLENAVEMDDAWTIYVQERASDGTPRGALVALPSPTGGFDPEDVTPIVAADGVHALVLYVNGGVHTLPLVCADP